jgi:uncharacterized phosphatase
MEIYFVRHGETGGNVAHRHQADDTPLTFLGEKQAKKVAAVVQGFKPTHLLSSKLVRAIATARVIGDECGLVSETSENFVELARPDTLYGHHHASVSSFIFYMQWYFGVGAGKRDGEPYQALRERILTAQAELSEYPNDARVVVVSHAVFINFFIAHLCRQQMLGPFGAARTFYKLLTMPNAEVIKITFDTTTAEGTCPWAVSQ